jgi:NAD(P)H-dependent FMN reductase
VDAAQGLPPGGLALKRRVEAADALLLAAPEYNYSVSGALKNAIDWVSRARPMPWRGRSVYLLSASPSPMGGIRGLWQTRIPLEGCGALVFPDMFALPHANEAFDAAGRLRDEKLAERLRREITGFVRLAESVAPVCAAAAAGIPDLRRQKIVAALETESELQPPSR